MSSGPCLWVRWEKQSVPALGFNMHVRRRLCARLWVYASGCPSWHLCFEGVTQPQNECERVWICPGLLGSTSWKSCGWMSPCVHWWMGLRMRVILISRLLWLTTSSTSEPSLHTYRIPMYTPSPSCTRTHRHKQTRTCSAAPAWHRGKGSGGEGSHPTRAENKEEKWEAKGRSL